MSQRRHREVERHLDACRARAVIDRYAWDAQGARYLVWLDADGAPVVFTLMATEAFIKGVEAATDAQRRQAVDFVAGAGGVEPTR